MLYNRALGNAQKRPSGSESRDFSGSPFPTEPDSSCRVRGKLTDEPGRGFWRALSHQTGLLNQQGLDTSQFSLSPSSRKKMGTCNFSNLHQSCDLAFDRYAFQDQLLVIGYRPSYMGSPSSQGGRVLKGRAFCGSW